MTYSLELSSRCHHGDRYNDVELNLNFGWEVEVFCDIAQPTIAGSLFWRNPFKRL